MAIPKFLEDLLIISKLGDNPGADNGLSSSGLREKFDEAGVKIQKYINDTLIPALSGLSNPEEGLNMKNDIAMGGHRVTGLGEPVADGDAVPLGYANGHYAPAGYGLGTEGGQLVDVTDFNQLDALNRNGHYFVRFAEPFYIGGVYAQFLTVDVSGETGQHCHQTIRIIGTNYVIRRNSDNGDWGVIEWENPPMIPGVEYRTTERHNEKPVFTKLFTTGALTNGGTFNYTGESVTVVRSAVTCLGHLLPYYAGGALNGGVWSIWYDITENQFTGYFGSGMSSNTYTAQVWCTKN